MAEQCMDIEEHELPSVEAVLAGTLALMTGYSQTLQAELHPQQRLSMGEKIGAHLSLLIDHPQLSLGFRQVLLGLQTRWRSMSACTREAARDCADVIKPGRADSPLEPRRPEPKRLH